MNQFVKVPIDGPLKDFDFHLKLLENKRILFSGKFGSGKTYFLKEFFKQYSNYEPIFIYPVNYQVARNEDIFELIKFDILLELLGKKLISSELDSTKESLIIQFYILNKSPNFIFEILNLIPKLGKVGDVTKSIIEYFQGYSDYKKELLQKSDIQIAEIFANGIENKPGSINENDLITQIIYRSLKSNMSALKESILIIDDLDRIDPEHIFRILNVFSTHFVDQYEENNKFGFDKIILVCDIENILKIFNSKYGQDVDFSGYIDKFYSHRCFHFTNNKSILNSIDSIFSPLNNLSKNRRQQTSIDIVKWFLIDFITVNAINHRDLQKIQKIVNPFPKGESYKMPDWFEFSRYDFVYLHPILLLKHIFGNDQNKLIKCFKLCQSNLGKTAIKNINEVSGNLAFFIEFTQAKFQFNLNQSISISNMDILLNFKMVEKLDSSLDTNSIKIEDIEFRDKNGNPKNLTIKEFYTLIERAYINIIEATRN